jgi:Family of unknown function (DUF6415)
VTDTQASRPAQHSQHDQHTIAGQFVPIDTDTIRRTCDSILWAPRLSEDERDVAALLLGHVNLLLPEVDDLATHAGGEQQSTAAHVVGRTRRTLRATGGTAPVDASGLSDMATLCRALLALYQQLSAGDDRSVHGADGGRR